MSKKKGDKSKYYRERRKKHAKRVRLRELAERTRAVEEDPKSALAGSSR